LSNEKIYNCITIFFIVAVDISYANLSDGLVAHYPFSGNANDHTNNGNDGTIFNATLTENRFNNPNSSYFFDGESYITFGNSNFFDLTELISISVWIKPFQQQGTIISKKQSCNHAATFCLLIDNDQLIFQYYDGVGKDKYYSIDYQFETNSWYHIVATYNYSTFQMNMYVNGIQEEGGWMFDRYPSNTTPLTTTNVLSIGAGIVYSNNGSCAGMNVGDPYYLFYGNIDDARIYKRILSKSEINELYGNNVGYKSCYEILEAGMAKGDGIYLIDTDGKGSNLPFEVYCDMTTSGGGWTFLTGSNAQNDYSSINSSCPNNLKPFEVRSTSHAIALEKFVKQNGSHEWYYANVICRSNN